MLILIYTTSCCEPNTKPAGEKTAKQTQRPALKKIGVCLPASPSLTAGAPAHEQTEPDQEAPKGEAEPGPMGEHDSQGTLGRLEGGKLMQSNHDKQDANCRHEQSHSTFLTADSWRCLIDSDIESEALEQKCLSLKLRHETFLIDADQRRDSNSNRAGKQINKQ